MSRILRGCYFSINYSFSISYNFPKVITHTTNFVQLSKKIRRNIFTDVAALLLSELIERLDFTFFLHENCKRLRANRELR